MAGHQASQANLVSLIDDPESILCATHIGVQAATVKTTDPLPALPGHLHQLQFVGSPEPPSPRTPPFHSPLLSPTSVSPPQCTLPVVLSLDLGPPYSITVSATSTPIYTSTALPIAMPTSVSAATPGGIGAMPVPPAKDVPWFSLLDFDDLNKFLEEFEHLTTVHGLSDEEHVHAIFHYADSDAKWLWKTADSYNKTISKCNWATFKKDLTEELAKKWQHQEMTSEADLDHYHHQFQLIAKALKTKGVISDNKECHTHKAYDIQEVETKCSELIQYDSMEVF
ncbi:hypothetical protein EDD18DRAFT_1098016 [Armillaria luteobubalina]|uniref:Retrotransposon gag domain-containing protein n=1 Tax=Armillaria luteobubalina TaxID=153913 RepID=A0AA39UWU8_9AGAR|nr:hypothetical protein EDD18DRAFT_1098016 [Armillaria luteobubalina]